MNILKKFWFKMKKNAYHEIILIMKTKFSSKFDLKAQTNILNNIA
jgi:hypothetical protein